MVRCSAAARGRARVRASGQPISSSRRMAAGCSAISERRDIRPRLTATVGTSLLLAGPARLRDDCALPRGAAKRGRVSVAILASRATRPVRWRRHLRAACFWLALALGVLATSKEVVGPFFSVLMFPPLGFGVRELLTAFGARGAGN